MHLTITPRRTALVAVAAAALFGSMLVAAPANAAPRSAADPLSDADTTALFAGVDTTTRTFDAAIARAAGADTSLVAEFAAGYVAGGGAVQHIRVDPDVVAATEGIGIDGCSGKSSFDVTGLQANLYLNSCVSNDVVGKLTQGAGVAAVVALISAETGVGAVAAGIVTGLLTIGAGALASCNAKGRGTVSHNIAGSAIVWCNGQ
ncbi:hypothetical protein [Curtobacterium sp. B18]|uniref:hypothetical protein n=1 Tax=Curtobacterium sp. B18 TaxID=95614 RepID=UPI000347E571|nr:hypothetical protein [Curtobacterium sp. B18]